MAGSNGKSGRKPKTERVKAPGKSPITFHKGGLHESVGVPQGQTIPPAKMAAAKAGKYGPKAAAQARFAENVLTGPKSGSSKSATPKPTRRKGSSRGKSS